MTTAALEQALQAALAPRDLLDPSLLPGVVGRGAAGRGPRTLRRAVPVPGDRASPSCCGARAR